jgi:hypothetical protein
MFLEATPIHCETIVPDHMSDSESDEEFAEYLPAYYKEAEPVQKKRRYDIRPLEPQTESNIWKPYKPKQQYLKTKAPYPSSKACYSLLVGYGAFVFKYCCFGLYGFHMLDSV